jgi:N-acetyl-1-D-myo-inositol-2-amino-2-deoxy-alpha-D-glucopyranoside deacetylase
MSPRDFDRRLLLVHAHPDDESIGTGATMAKYVAEGAYVCLVTCTQGEEGEVIPEEMRHLASDRENRLGGHRVGELAAACEALGVSDWRFLGGSGRWRDSGMMGTRTNDEPRSFWRADLDQSAAPLVSIIREVRPQVIVTYDARGFYGHPDHIQAHRVARLAAGRAADPDWIPPLGRDGSSDRPWRTAKFYATAMPRSVLRDGLSRLRRADPGFLIVDSVSELPYGVPDERVTTAVDGTGQLAAKIAAMRAHRTQIRVDPPFFALSDGVGQELNGVEYYTLLDGALGPRAGADGREDDLFAGVSFPDH